MMYKNTCDGCVHNKGLGPVKAGDEPCWTCLHSENLPGWASRLPMTNYDRLVSKTPEELAEWISFAQTAGVYTIRGKHAWIEWLKSPVNADE